MTAEMREGYYCDACMNFVTKKEVEGNADQEPWYRCGCGYETWDRTDRSHTLGSSDKFCDEVHMNIVGYACMSCQEGKLIAAWECDQDECSTFHDTERDARACKTERSES